MSYLQKKKLAFMSIVNSVKGFVRKVSGVPPLTLPNCADEDSLIEYSITGTSNGVGDRTKNLYFGENKVSCTSSVKNYTDTAFFEIFKEGIGKTYTLYCYVDNSNVTTGPSMFRMSVGYKGGSWAYNYSTSISSGCKGWVGAIISIPENYNGQLNMQFSAGGQGVEFSNFLLLEGEYNKWATPEYEPYGYKIPVVASNGENSLTTNIYLDEPLGEGESISFPEDDLPKLPTFKGTTIYDVATTVQPSSMEVTYYATKKGE